MAVITFVLKNAIVVT